MRSSKDAYTGSTGGELSRLSPRSLLDDMTTNQKIEKARRMADKTMELSCTAMCEEKPWSKGDHKTTVDTIDAYNDALRSLQTIDYAETIRHF